MWESSGTSSSCCSVCFYGIWDSACSLRWDMLGAGVDERCELDQLELDPVTFLNAFENLLPTFLIPDILANKQKPNTRKDYVSS